MATSIRWTDVLELLTDMDARAANAHAIDQLQWHLLDLSTHQANTLLLTGNGRSAGGVPPAEVPQPPVVPPDDPRAPDVEREPSIDPPPTAPPADAPSEDPRRPPAPPRTTKRLFQRGE
ncbi:MAG: hypothetical protein O2917_03415 [Acidobacteria bacterium]|nr:hypothetical protein [Acidobacteriota bacterium]